MSDESWVEAERIAAAFHEAYERLAPSHGYETRRESAVPFDELPGPQHDLMVDTVHDLIVAGALARTAERDQALAALREHRTLLEEAVPYMENHPRTHAKRIGAEIRSALSNQEKP